MNFSLYTRVTDATWPQLEPYARDGDLYWGRVAIPPARRALTFSSYEGLVQRLQRENIADYSALSLDGEYEDFALALADAPRIRQWISDNAPALRFVAFYHLNIIDAYPDVVRYPDVTIVGKTAWSAANMQAKAKKYIDLVLAAGKTPAILLGDLKAENRSKTPNTPAEVLANFKEVTDAPPDGLGLTTVAYFYAGDNAELLLGALKSLRS